MADEDPDGDDPPEWALRRDTPHVQPTKEEIEADPDIECPECGGDMWIVGGEIAHPEKGPGDDYPRKCVECGHTNDVE